MNHMTKAPKWAINIVTLDITTPLTRNIWKGRTGQAARLSLHQNAAKNKGANVNSQIGRAHV